MIFVGFMIFDFDFEEVFEVVDDFVCIVEVFSSFI